MEVFPRELLYYETADGRVPARDWLDAKEGSEEYGKIMTRLERVQQGNCGDHGPVGEGVSELRIDFGPGYRVYYGRDGIDFVILLVVGSKKTQQADIDTAKGYWEDYNA